MQHNRQIQIYAEVWQAQAVYLPKMPRLAFSVNTDLLEKFCAHQIIRDVIFARVGLIN